MHRTLKKDLLRPGVSTKYHNPIRIRYYHPTRHPVDTHNPQPRSTQWSIQYHYGANRASTPLQPQLAVMLLAHPKKGPRSTPCWAGQAHKIGCGSALKTLTPCVRPTAGKWLWVTRSENPYTTSETFGNCPPLPTQRDRRNKHVAHTPKKALGAPHVGQAKLTKLVVGQPI